ncbi:MAG TPA: patatin-like phospholipase family protein [Gemmatimonadales bacterium]|nr:patatin-like phospholipase family protein [Gemmatimonadales bacterium]
MSPVRHIPSARPIDLTRPDERPSGVWRYSSHLALVLGGGGARGAYQVGVLAGLAERLPGLAFPIIAGTSVGAINSVFLAADLGALGEAVAGLRTAWAGLTSEGVFQLRLFSLITSLARKGLQSVTGLGGGGGPAGMRGLADTKPLREFLARGADLRGITANIANQRLRAVAINATSYTSGRAVSFVQAAPEIQMWERVQRLAVRTQLTLDHIMASAALPLVFPAVRIGDEFYGDGSVRQMAPFAPALHLGARAILAIGLRVPRAARLVTQEMVSPSAAEAMGLLFDAIFLDAMEADAERLDRINNILAAFPEGQPRPTGLQPIELLMLHPTRDLAALAAGKTHLLPSSVRHAVRAIGGHKAGAAEMLGFLLFHPEHTSLLVEAGYEDIGAQWPAIEKFFEKLARSPDKTVL